MEKNTLATIFWVIGWAIICISAFLLIFSLLQDNIPFIEIALFVAAIFSGLFFFAIAEAINLLSRIEYNTRKESQNIVHNSYPKKAAVSANNSEQEEISLNNPEALQKLLDAIKKQEVK